MADPVLDPAANDAAQPATTPISAPEPAGVTDVPPVQAGRDGASDAPVVDSSAAGAEAQPAPAAEVPEPSLLEKFDADKKAADTKPEEKPADAPKADEPKPETDAAKPEDATKDGEPETAAVEEPAPLDPIDYYAAEGGLVIPDTLKLSDDHRTELASALDKFRADPSATNAQGIIDMGVKAMEQMAVDLRQGQWDAFNEARKGWREKVMADPAMGGAGFETSMGEIARVRDTLVSRHKPGTPGHEADLAEFQDMLRATGVGDHPAFLRLLHNGARFFDEARQPPPNPKPDPNAGKGNGRRRLGDTYNHPTSRPDH